MFCFSCHPKSSHQKDLGGFIVQTEGSFRVNNEGSSECDSQYPAALL